MRKRIILLVGINIGILISLNILLWMIETIFDISVGQILGQQQGIIIISVVFGFGGAIVNLMISKWTAKRIYRLQPIDQDSSHEKLRAIQQTVQELAYNHHIFVPEVYYYDSQEVNAFATGASKNNSLIAVSKGLINIMDTSEIKAVVGHEMTHILNGDMVTTTLLQGSLNTFTVLLARIVGGVVDGALSNNNDEQSTSYGMGYYMIVNVLEVIFGIISGLILMAYSRTREYKADEGSATMLSKSSMINALKKLGGINDNPVPHDGFTAMKISGGTSWTELRASHPPIEKRIQHLQGLQTL